MLYIGIDLGTAAVKFLLMDGAGAIKHIVSEAYSIYFPKPGCLEQSPEDWWCAVKRGMKCLMDGIDARRIAGIKLWRANVWPRCSGQERRGHLSCYPLE